MNLFLYFHIQTRSCSYYILLRTDSSFFIWSLKTLLNNLFELVLGISGTILTWFTCQKHSKNLPVITTETPQECKYIDKWRWSDKPWTKDWGWSVWLWWISSANLLVLNYILPLVQQTLQGVLDLHLLVLHLLQYFPLCFDQHCYTHVRFRQNLSANDQEKKSRFKNLENKPDKSWKRSSSREWNTLMPPRFMVSSALPCTMK